MLKKNGQVAFARALAFALTVSIVAVACITTPTPRIWPLDDSEGGWQIETEIDPLMDKERITAALLPKDPIRQEKGTLAIQCGYIAEGEAKAAVFFREALRESSLNQVQYRFDDGETETETWETSPNRLAVLASAPSEFIWKLMNSEKLVVREEDGQILTFDVEGLSTALYSHRDKCDWIGVGSLGKKANRPTSTSSPTATARPTAIARPTNPPAPAPQPTSTPLSGVGGAPLPEEFTGGEEIAATASTSEMMGIGANGLSGTLHLIQIERQTKVTVTLDNAGPGPYAAVIRRGGCPDEGGEPDGQFDYILFDIVDGQSLSMVGTPAQFFQFSLAYVIVVDGEDLVNDPPISCGNIPSPLR